LRDLGCDGLPAMIVNLYPVFAIYSQYFRRIFNYT
jgi:hypothetical protein